MLVSAYTDVSGDLLYPLGGGSRYWPRSRTWLGFLRWPPAAALKPSEWPRLLDVEVGASVLAVGVHVGVSPIELLDFVVGLTGLVQPASIMKVLERRIPSGFVEMNRQALELGLAMGQAAA